MTQNYGGSFAQRLIDQGEFEAAVAEATRAFDKDRNDPEPLVDRASALASLLRYAEAVNDLEAALVLDEAAQVLETDEVDDALFSALLCEARALADVAAAVVRLRHYAQVLPEGRHGADVDLWTRRLRGEGLDEPIVKEHV